MEYIKFVAPSFVQLWICEQLEIFYEENPIGGRKPRRAILVSRVRFRESESSHLDSNYSQCSPDMRHPTSRIPRYYVNCVCLNNQLADCDEVCWRLLWLGVLECALIGVHFRVSRGWTFQCKICWGSSVLSPIIYHLLMPFSLRWSDSPHYNQRVTLPWCP